MRDFDENEHVPVERQDATVSELLDAIFELIENENLRLVRERYGSQRTILVRLEKGICK